MQIICSIVYTPLYLEMGLILQRTRLVHRIKDDRMEKTLIKGKTIYVLHNLL